LVHLPPDISLNIWKSLIRLKNSLKSSDRSNVVFMILNVTLIFLSTSFLILDLSWIDDETVEFFDPSLELAELENLLSLELLLEESFWLELFESSELLSADEESLLEVSGVV